MFCRTSPNFKALGPQDGHNAHLTLRAVQEQPGRVRGSAPFPVAGLGHWAKDRCRRDFERWFLQGDLPGIERSEGWLAKAPAQSEAKTSATNLAQLGTAKELLPGHK